MWFIGVEVAQETSAPLLKKILDPPLIRHSLSSPDETPRSSSKIAVRHIFNALLGVTSGDKHCVSCLIYYFIYAKEINCNQDPPGCQR